MLVALGQLVIIAIGQMNLALGAIGGLVAISFAAMMELWGFPPMLAFVCGLGIGVLAGMASGFVIARTGITAFIITLAGLQIFKGINLGITGAQPFYGVPQSVKDFGNTALFGTDPVACTAHDHRLGSPSGICSRGCASAATSSPSAATAAQPNSPASISGSTVIWAHAISGLLAAAAGMMLVARLQIGHPTIGDDWLISSFAAPVIGGAMLSGGHVSVAGTFFGVVIIAIITQALVLFAIDPFVVQIVLGGLILWAVGINRLREVRMAKAMGQTADA